MRKRGIEWEQLGTHNEHLSVLDFKKQERAKEVENLESEVKNAECVLGYRKELLDGIEQVIDKLDTEYQKKNFEVEKLDSEISEKKNIKAKTEAVLSEKQAILGECIQKVVKINFIDHIETGKTIFGGKVTVAENDYKKLTDLAKKQIADESREDQLTAEVTKLKKENEELSSENNALRENVRAARSLQSSYSALQRELESWKQRYKKVIEFIEKLGLKDKLEKFLHPVTQVKRGR